jgi:hypothetical protein
MVMRTQSYNVINEVTAGKEVTPDIPVGNYVIENGGKVSLHAGESIVLSDGFTASAGSHFYAYIEPFFTCTYSAPSIVRGDNNEQVPVIKDYSVEKSNFQNSENTTLEKELYLKLYPNPSTGNVTIEYSLNKSEMVEITLHDNFGKPVYILKNKTPHDSGVYKISLTGVELPAGIYYCTLKTDNTQRTEKLMMVR